MREGVRRLGLTGSPLCVHSSLRSFGIVEGGSSTIIEGLLTEGCTALVPTFSSEAYEVLPPQGVTIPFNGSADLALEIPSPGVKKGVYTLDSTEIDRDMGAVPTGVLAMPQHLRSTHPLRSFAAVGPRAIDLVPQDAPVDAFSPLERLAEINGAILLMGVGLDKTTAVHLAERRAGRRMFQRWANGRDLKPVQVDTGGCSNGFVALDDLLKDFERKATVGDSLWRAFPITELLEAATTAIRDNSKITHCGDPDCIRCDHMMQGGPTLHQR